LTLNRIYEVPPVPPHTQLPTTTTKYSFFYSTDTGGSSLQVMLLGHEPDNSLPSNADIKNEWSYISTPPYAFMV
jgi:hypothetical protein